ncbi:hypothetical protein AAHH78_36040, partial [Burkholderia pseudomallei]
LDEVVDVAFVAGVLGLLRVLGDELLVFVAVGPLVVEVVVVVVDVRIRCLAGLVLRRLSVLFFSLWERYYGR